MVEFSQKLKPIFIDNSELIRLGSIDDGGYVVPVETVMTSNILMISTIKTYLVNRVVGLL